MSWSSFPGTGNLDITSLNQFRGGGLMITDVATVNLSVTSGTVAQVGSLARANLGFTDVRTDLRVNSGGNLQIGDGLAPTSAQGTLLIRPAVTAPTSGDVTSGGVLYIQSGGLHFMGENGTVTVVASP